MGLRKRVSDGLYQVGPARYYQPTYRRIAESFGLQEGTLVDLGCGPGWVAIRMAERAAGASVIGIDHSREMVAAGRRNGGHMANLRFLEMDGAQMSLDDGAVALCIAVQTAHHWTQPDAVLSEIARILRPDGRLVLLEADRQASTVPAGWIERSGGLWPPDTVVKNGWRRFGMNETEWSTMRDLVEDAGLVVVRDQAFGFYRCIEAELPDG